MQRSDCKIYTINREVYTYTPPCRKVKTLHLLRITHLNPWDGILPHVRPSPPEMPRLKNKFIAGRVIFLVGARLWEGGGAQ